MSYFYSRPSFTAWVGYGDTAGNFIISHCDYVQYGL